MVCTGVQDDSVVAAAAGDDRDARIITVAAVHIGAVDTGPLQCQAHLFTEQILPDPGNHPGGSAQLGGCYRLIAALAAGVGKEVAALYSLSRLGHGVAFNGQIHIQAAEYNDFSHRIPSFLRRLVRKAGAHRCGKTRPLALQSAV